MALNESDVGGPERDPGLEQLYARARLEEPPRELDQAIRAAARREAHARPHALGARLRRWTLPVSVAAVVVLSVSIVTLMREEGAGRLEEGFSPAPEQPVGAAPAPASGAKQKAVESAEVPQPALPPGRAPATLSATERTSEERRDAPVAGQVRPTERITGDVRREAVAEDKKRPKRQEDPSGLGATATLPEARPARALPAPAATLQRVPVEAESDSAGKRDLAKSEGSLTDDQFNELLNKLEKAPPEIWLEKIAALRREGNSRTADELLSRFRRRFPDYPLPDAERSRGH